MNFRVVNYLFFCLILFSCQATRTNKYGGKIKSESKIIFKDIDNTLNDKSKISGYVYSKFDQHFLSNAYVEIGDTLVKTNNDGFFSININPGTYNITTTYIGNIEESIKNISIANNEHVIILFKLGAFWIY